MNKFILLFSALIGCSAEQQDQNTGYVDTLTPVFLCSHPHTEYEAQIEVYYQEDPFVNKVEVIIEQGEISFVAPLIKPNKKYEDWHRIINILNFDCTKDYDYAFVATEISEED